MRHVPARLSGDLGGYAEKSSSVELQKRMSQGLKPALMCTRIAGTKIPAYPRNNRKRKYGDSDSASQNDDGGGAMAKSWAIAKGWGDGEVVGDGEGVG